MPLARHPANTKSYQVPTQQHRALVQPGETGGGTRSYSLEIKTSLLLFNDYKECPRISPESHGYLRHTSMAGNIGQRFLHNR
jgi:hypothetical protein